jgi:hypothetical protein
MPKIQGSGLEYIENIFNIDALEAHNFLGITSNDNKKVRMFFIGYSNNTVLSPPVPYKSVDQLGTVCVLRCHQQIVG